MFIAVCPQSKFEGRTPWIRESVLKYDDNTIRVTVMMTTMAMITKMIIAMKEYVVYQGFISKGTIVNK